MAQIAAIEVATYAGALRLANHLDHRKPLEDLFPDDGQLHLGHAVADAAVDAEAERHVLAGPLAVDDEFVGALDLVLVAVAGDVPHHHLVALLDLTAGKLDIVARGAAHVQHRRVVADGLGHQVRDQFASGADQLELLRILAQRHQPR